MTGHVYAVVGGREGAGATTTALALGASLAEMSHRVGIVDADFGDEGIAAALDLPEGPVLRDVLRGDVDLAEALVDGPHGLEILPSEAGVPEPTDVRLHALVRATSAVRERFDVVLIDLGAGGGVPAAVALERADEVVLATPPDDDAVAATAAAATTARHHGADVLGAVLTRTPGDADPDHDAVRAALEADLLALVPEDEAVPESAAERTSLLRHDPDSGAAMVYWELARRLVDGDATGSPVAREGVPVTGESEGDAVPDGAVEPGAQSGGAAGEQSEVADERTPEPAEPIDPAGTAAPAPDATRDPPATADETGGDSAGTEATSQAPDAPADAEAPIDGIEGASTEEFDWQDGATSTGDDADADDPDGADAADGSGESADEEDEMEAAFKQTMEKVRKEREAEKRASGDDSDDEKGLFDGLIG